MGFLDNGPPGAGPLVAVLAGVGALGNPRTVVLLACDLPFIEPAVLRLLMEWPGTGTVIPVVGGRFQYACARYGHEQRDIAEATHLPKCRFARDLGDHTPAHLRDVL